MLRQRTGPLPWVVVLLGAAGAGGLPAAEYHVAPAGAATAGGTKAEPLDLATALGPASPAKPGDTIWLRGGTYRGGFTSKVAGRDGAPVTIRGARGERATIDCRWPDGRDAPTLLFVEGGWCVFRDLEVTCSDPHRVTKLTGSAPGDVRRGGVFCTGGHVKFVNLVVHDCSNGFGFWSGGEGGEIYGCVIYNNGWLGPDRGHGHAIYTQNKTGTKRLADNVMFNQFSYGVHAYGSSRAFLSGFHVEGNVSFCNGSAASPDGRTPAILIGGGGPAERIALLSNFTYGDEKGGGSVRLGYGSRPNVDLVARGNYLVGGVDVKLWRQVTFEDNTVLGAGSLVSVEVPDGTDPRTYAWDRNTYLRTATKWPPFGVRRGGKGQAMSFAKWQGEGLDAKGRCDDGQPTGVKVFVRPNQYEPGRGHVVVYNWGRKPAVAVDLSGVLKSGQRYRIVSAQDYYGPAVLVGTFDGQAVQVPMKAYRAVPPIGRPDHKPPVTGPVFNVFVVLPAE